MSQSIEMERQGYQIAVPYQKNAWCYCDNAILNAEDYEDGDSQMHKLYPEYFPTERTDEEVKKYRENSRIAKQMRELLIRYMELHLYHDAGKLAARHAGTGNHEFNGNIFYGRDEYAEGTFQVV